MNGISWFMYASIAVWLGLGAYLFLLGNKSARLEARLRRLERAEDKKTAPTGDDVEE